MTSQKNGVNFIDKKHLIDTENFNPSPCLVPIHDPTDKLETFIKQTFAIGEVFKSKKALFETIGIENLGLKNLNGGKQKQIANDIVSQYLSMCPLDNKKQMQQITDIYEIPHLLEKTDNRGKSGFYIDRGIPVLLNYFRKEDQIEICTNVNNLSKIIGLVGNKFKYVSEEELLKQNPKFTKRMFQQFYFRCKPEQEAVVFRILDRLQNDYSVISYYRNFKIIHEDGRSHVSVKEEDILIRNIQRLILKEFNAKTLLTIYQNRQEKEFYRRVCQAINHKYNKNWSNYYSQIELFIDIEGVKNVCNDFCMSSEILLQNKKDILQRFSERIKHITQKDIHFQEKKKESLINSWLESDESNESNELIGLDALGLYIYPDDYYEIQCELIDFLLGPNIK